MQRGKGTGSIIEKAIDSFQKSPNGRRSYSVPGGGGGNVFAGKKNNFFLMGSKLFLNHSRNELKKKKRCGREKRNAVESISPWATDIT